MYFLLLLQVPCSIPRVGDYCGEYPLHCKFPGEIFHRGGHSGNVKGFEIP